MKNKLLYILTFAAGCGVGVGASYYYFKRKYEIRINEEFQKERDNRLNKVEETEEEEPTEEETEVKVYETIVKTEYTNYSNKVNVEEKDIETPYVIKPDEFGEVDDYETETYYYYANGILANEYDKVIDDIKNTVGLDFKTHFGEYEKDAVYIRNDYKETDYEILRDFSNFPGLTED